eukprot:TRINITY_DN10345_c0_g1_i3.p2 TRINITY_DN10345_c0_g1~~TRINITY_DN10345_c0_g1_i3.p2  ORF type:complete len:158 (+),score=47.05 TRINITY_DN10345_c0_g1_i3:85-558(+)
MCIRDRSVLMMDWGLLAMALLLCLVGSLAGMALSPGMSLLFQAANTRQPVDFWQVYALYDLWFAAGVAVGPLLGAALTDSALDHKQRPLSYQLVLSVVLVLGFSVLLACTRRNGAAIKEFGPMSTGGGGSTREPSDADDEGEGPHERTSLISEPSLL